MRILFCLNGPNELNGPNVWLSRHLPRLRRHGLEPRVLYLSRTPDASCRFRTALEAEGIPTRAVALQEITEEDVPAILQAIAVERPDVFVPNYSVPGYFACRWAREAGVRTIGVLHSDDPYYHDLLDLCVSGPEPWRLDGIVAVSDFLAGLAAEKATSSTRVLRAPCGAPFGETTAVEPAETMRLLYVGRFVERQKRVRRVTERLCSAVTMVPGVDAVMYGDGSERADVEALVSQRAPERVRLASLSPDAMHQAMLEGHALLLLSDFEGLSMALMEAMACGLVPIVSPMRSGTHDLIEHDVNALVVDADSEAAFVEAVRRLREEPGLWGRLSAAARRTIVDRGYTSDDCARRWAEFCLGLRPATPPRAIAVPSPDDLELPAQREHPFGITGVDRRRPWKRLQAAARNGRPIYVWGTGAGGRRFLAAVTGRQIPIAGVVDRRAGPDWPALEGIPVHPPSRLAEERVHPHRPFIVIASSFVDEISGQLRQMGFESDKDFNIAGNWP